MSDQTKNSLSVDISDLSPDQRVEMARQWEIQQAQIAKERLRMQIENVADSKTREGVVSDVLAVVVVGFAQMTVALSKAQTLADVRAAVQPMADVGTAVDEAVKTGALVLPFMVKPGGAEGVLADLMKVSNGVTAVLAPQHSEQPA